MFITKQKTIMIFYCVSFTVFPSVALCQNNLANNGNDQEKQKIISQKEIGDRPGSGSYQSLILNSELIISLTGIIIGVLVVMWQLNRQHKSSLKLQKWKFITDLNLDIYKQLSGKISIVSDQLITVSNAIRVILSSLKIYLFQIEHGMKPPPIQGRMADVLKLHFDALEKLIAVIVVIEEYEIINPKFSIFKTAILSAHHDIMNSFGGLSDKLQTVLPIETPNHQGLKKDSDVIVPKIPTKNDLDQIEEIAESYYDTISLASSFVFDLSRESQNLLLGDIFKNKLSPREPIDQKYFVITTEDENIQKLKKYFNEETEWGKSIIKAEKSAFDKLKCKE